MAIECLIIEDDQSAVKIIKKLEYDFDQVSFSYIIENQEEALNTILRTRPDIIFINIESEKINFLEFLYEVSQYAQGMPNLIALSSSKENAYDAFKYNFSTFILKPFTEYYIRKSLASFLEKYVPKQIESICLKSNKDFQYLCMSDIMYLQADNNTTDFYMSDSSIVNAYKTLKVFEQSLPDTFYRVHKSFIINIYYISRIHFGKSMCIIKNKHKIPFTKTFLENINTINTILSDNALYILK